MKLIETAREMLADAESARCNGRTVALVPTMGALHEGHLALVREAARRADYVVVSIFVNPTQFGPSEDFDRYPRPMEADLAHLEKESLVDAVFAPPVEEMYPHGASTSVKVAALGDHLCGAVRPGHFDGVTTVVARLFSICRPQIAVFGRKDAQQYVILRRMAVDLFPGTEVVGAETIREDDGLALSSRNRYLDNEERRQAVVLSQALFGARDLIMNGERNARIVIENLERRISTASRGRLQYAEIVDAETLQPVRHIQSRQTILAAVAVYFGGTRLIDNQFIEVPA